MSRRSRPRRNGAPGHTGDVMAGYLLTLLRRRRVYVRVVGLAAAVPAAVGFAMAPAAFADGDPAAPTISVESGTDLVLHLDDNGWKPSSDLTGTLDVTLAGAGGVEPAFAVAWEGDTDCPTVGESPGVSTVDDAKPDAGLGTAGYGNYSLTLTGIDPSCV